VIWELRTDSLRYLSNKLSNRRINKLAFSTDGHLFLAHNELDVWNTDNGEQLASVPGVSMFEFSPSGTIVVPQEDGFDELDRKTYQRIRHHAFAFHPDSGGVWDSPTQMCRLPDGRILEQAYTGEIRVWNFEKAKSSTTIEPDIVIPRAAREKDGTLSYAWSLNATYDADGYVIAAAGEDSTVRIWNLADGGANSTIDLRGQASASDEPRLMTFIPLPAHRLAIVRENGATAIWNIATRSWTGEPAPVMKDYVRE
jgi:WD40 repeat protein